MKNRFSKPLSKLGAAAALVFSASVAQAEPVVDVLVLYLDAAERTNSGRDINARISSYIEYSNQAFENSQVDMRLRLVGAEKLNADYTYVTNENLDALRRNAEVARLRQAYGADLVTLINLRHSMSGGYVCGIAYVPGGNSSTGQLASNAGSAAFSLVGVDCGLNTFIHELGHNMSLGHSYAQNSEGGVWRWGRGHGVQGLFSTVMAYPQSYGTRNQVQSFSNPALENCSGQACGVHRDHAHGADAARNLNSVDQQVSDFIPRVIDVDEPDSALQPCDKEDVEGNLINNGEFDALQNWTTLFNASRLAQVEHSSDCVDQRLVVTDRSQLHSDAYQNLSDRIEIGKDYTFSGRFGVAGTSRDTVRFALRIQEGSGIRYQYLEPLSATSNELTQYSQAFRLDADEQPDQVGIVFYGPQPGVDIVADELVLLDVSEPEPEPENQVVLHERFEREAQGWSSYGGSRTAFSTQAYEGTYSIRNHSRSYNYSGPMREVTGLIEAGQSYEINTQVYVQDTASSSGTAAVWIYYVDEAGGNWEQVLQTSVAANRWQEVNGEFSLNPNGEITQMRLLIGGPRNSADLYIDELQLIRR